MSTETIKDFLVSLGFDVDESGQKKFESVIKGVTANVLKMGLAVEAGALTIVGFTTKIADGLDKLYFASQRTGASVAGIKALGYAASQTGTDAAAAQNSLESLAKFMRNSPGAEGFLNRLGVKTKDSKGARLDTSAIFTGVGEKLKNMPYYKANQYAQMLGIDENTLMSIRSGLTSFTADYQSMLSKTGFDAEKAAKQSNKFMTSMRGLTSLFGILRDKIGSNLAGGLSGSLETLRKRILDNFPLIEKTITNLIKGVLFLADIFSRMAYRVTQAAGSIIDWWKRLDDGSKKLIAMFGAIVVAWRLLNSAFLMSPIGLITALIVSIGLLYEDYQTWKEGGKSLIDWDKWEPAIKYTLKACEEISASFLNVWVSLLKLKDAVQPLIDQLEKLFKLVYGEFSAKSFFDSFIDSIKKTNEQIAGMLDALTYLAKGDFSGAMTALKKVATVSVEKLMDSPLVKSSNSFGRQIGESIVDTAKSWGNYVFGGSNDGSGVAEAHSDRRGLRNNNPGNLNFVGQKGASLERPGGRFAKFETAFDGLRAMSRQLTLYAKRGIDSVSSIISTWAPASDGNNTQAYVNGVAKALGVNPNSKLNMSDPQVMSTLMNSIIQHENGRNPYGSELVGAAAQAGIGGGVQQTTNITVYGAKDAESTANEVSKRQIDVNARVTQQYQRKVT